MKAIKLNSDNFENVLVTKEAYEELVLQMSSGDFGSHTHEEVEVPDGPQVITVEDVLFDAHPAQLDDEEGVYDTKTELLVDAAYAALDLIKNELGEGAVTEQLRAALAKAKGE